MELGADIELVKTNNMGQNYNSGFFFPVKTNNIGQNYNSGFLFLLNKYLFSSLV